MQDRLSQINHYVVALPKSLQNIDAISSIIEHISFVRLQFTDSALYESYKAGSENYKKNVYYMDVLELGRRRI